MKAFEVFTKPSEAPKKSVKKLLSSSRIEMVRLNLSWYLLHGTLHLITIPRKLIVANSFTKQSLWHWRFSQIFEYYSVVTLVDVYCCYKTCFFYKLFSTFAHSSQFFTYFYQLSLNTQSRFNRTKFCTFPLFFFCSINCKSNSFNNESSFAFHSF